MPVYVDSMRAPYRGMTMCHMLADTTAELLHMADRIGVDRKWIQNPGTPREHFDIALTKRARAVALGAVEVRMRDMGMLVRKKQGRPYDPACATCRN